MREGRKSDEMWRVVRERKRIERERSTKTEPEREVSLRDGFIFSFVFFFSLRKRMRSSFAIKKKYKWAAATPRPAFTLDDYSQYTLLLLALFLSVFTSVSKVSICVARATLLSVAEVASIPCFPFSLKLSLSRPCPSASSLSLT